jgi:hypothetical protein
MCYMPLVSFRYMPDVSALGSDGMITNIVTGFVDAALIFALFWFMGHRDRE